MLQHMDTQPAYVGPPVASSIRQRADSPTVRDEFGVVNMRSHPSARTSPRFSPMRIASPTFSVLYPPEGAVITPYSPGEFLVYPPPPPRPPTPRCTFQPSPHTPSMTRVEHSPCPPMPSAPAHSPSGLYRNNNSLNNAEYIPAARLPSFLGHRSRYGYPLPTIRRRQHQPGLRAIRQTAIANEKQFALEGRRQQYDTSVPPAQNSPACQMAPLQADNLIFTSLNTQLNAKDSSREVSETETESKKSQQEEDREARLAFERSEPIQIVNRECSSHFLYAIHNRIGDAQVSPPHGIEPDYITASTIADIIQKVETPADVDALMPSLVEALKRERKMMKNVFKMTHSTMYASKYDEKGPYKHYLSSATRTAAIAKFQRVFATVRFRSSSVPERQRLLIKCFCSSARVI